MNEEYASLVIRIDALEATVAEGRLDRLEKQSARTERATDGLTASFKRLIVPIASVVSVSAGLNKLVAVTREFDVLNAQLVTATGNAENAVLAFTEIQRFATDTPYDLQQVTNSFVQLVNYGLTPSQRALTSYGDTSSALGRDLSQMIEAVADATVGEFERLKEFGIKASSEGDRVTFTFRGIATEVGKNSKEIEEYLIGLGENNFAGAMVERMNTLDGALSNLGDEWDKMFLRLGDQGLGQVITDGVRTAIDAIEELNAMLESGQLLAYLEATGARFDQWGEGFAFTLDLMDQLFKDWAKGTSEEGKDLVDVLVDAFKYLPENIRAFVQLMTTELAVFIDKAGAYGEEISDALKFWDGDTFNLDEELARINDVRRDSIELILLERHASKQSFLNQTFEAELLRKKYDELSASRETTDLGQFKAASPEVIEQTKEQKRALDGLRDAYVALLPEYERNAAEIATWRDQSMAALDETAEGYEEFVELIDYIFRKRMDEIRRDWLAGWKRGFESYADDATNAAKQVEGVIDSSLKSSERAFVGFMRGTEDAWADFWDGMVDEVIAAWYRMNIAGPIAQFMGSMTFGSSASTATGPTMSGPTNFGSSAVPASFAHTGGVVGSSNLIQRSVPTSAFDHAPRYHSGGVVGLAPDERAAVLQVGETVFTKEQTRELGRQINNKDIDVTVNIINNGTPVETQSTNARFDGKRLIIDTVMSEIQRGGPLRNQIKHLR